MPKQVLDVRLTKDYQTSAAGGMVSNFLVEDQRIITSIWHDCLDVIYACGQPELFLMIVLRLSCLHYLLLIRCFQYVAV